MKQFNNFNEMFAANNNNTSMSVFNRVRPYGNDELLVEPDNPKAFCSINYWADDSITTADGMYIEALAVMVYEGGANQVAAIMDSMGLNPYVEDDCCIYSRRLTLAEAQELARYIDADLNS